MKSFFEISSSVFNGRVQIIRDSYYSDILTYNKQLESISAIPDILNSIDALTYEKIIITAFKNLSNCLEEVFGEMYQYAIANDIYWGTQRGVLRRKLIFSNEIYEYLDQNNQSLWAELRNWHIYHQNFIDYHNNIMATAESEGYNSGAIGAQIGGLFGPLGAIIGGGIMGYLKGEELEEQYQSTLQYLYDKYMLFLTEFDKSWDLFVDNLSENIINEIDARYDEAREKSNN